MTEVIKIKLVNRHIINATVVDGVKISTTVKNFKVLDGFTPEVGENGNWFINSVDTGKPSQGVDGAIGPQGEVGPKGDTGLKGDKGNTGERGLDGIQGIDGKDGLTTQITVDNTTYTQVDGVISLPNYPDITGKQEKTDNSLITVSKDVVGAINEIDADLTTLIELVGTTTQALGDRRNGI